MNKNTIIGKGKGARTVGQIKTSVSLLKELLFVVMVPAYGRAYFDGIEIEEQNRLIKKSLVATLKRKDVSASRDVSAILMSALMKENVFDHLHRLISDIRDAGAFN